ncbi:uncharacterized protein [Nicotiana sylvestris]|uniref:uncharacterized protein n=1 Tax=Nicotiana sylvestris TaxID=4096 RepID=UPI00388C864B
MFFDGAANFKGVGIGAVLVSKTSPHYPVFAKLRFPCTNNMVEYESCILGLRLFIDMNVQELLVIRDFDLFVHQVLGEWATKNTKILPYMYYVKELIKRFMKIEFKYVPRIQNEFGNALATLSSMIQHPDKNFIDHIPIGNHKQPAYCAHVKEESDGNPFFHDIKEYLEKGEYLEHATHTQKRTLRGLANHFFQSGGIMYRRTPNLGLLRCVDAKEASKLLEEIHAGTYGPHMTGFILAKKILRAGYFWMTMETDCIKFILVAINYFTKWVDAASYKVITKKVIADFVRDRIICLLGVPKSSITNNVSNLNSDLMKAMCETFKIKHKNSTAYRLQMNRVVQAVNKKIKKILRKMVDNYKQWHEKLPFALLGYRTTVRTSTAETPYQLVYGSGNGGVATTLSQNKFVDEEQLVQEDEMPSNEVKANDEVRIVIVEETQEEVNSSREHIVDIPEPVVPKAKAPMPRPPPPYPQRLAKQNSENQF